jgi:hypothetical protein
MSMTLTEAMGWATTALETRARQWRDAADGNFDQDELFDADTDERLNMADMYEEARATLENYKPMEMHTYPSGLQVPLSIYEANKRFEEDNKQRP